jgi:hypothetical protein
MILVTGGCSFSDYRARSWPVQLTEILSGDPIYTGMSSQGNGMISRKIIYTLSELLKTTDPSDLLVGIMWSGPDRHDFYTTEDPGFSTNIDNWLENPTSVVPDSPGNWVILNHNWKNRFAKEYYSTFYDHIGALVYTYEHILRVQWFLKLHNIKYFMTTYTGEVFANSDHADTKHLLDQIDTDHFLPVVGEYEWCRDYSGITYPDPYDKHPSEEQHKRFTEQVIIPFLQNKRYV